MNYGVCTLAVVPVRIQPGDQQEMCNQLLFGDLVVIKGQVKDWLLIETFDDQYEGWIDQKQISIIENDLFNALIVSDRHYAVPLSSVVNEHTDDKLTFTCGAHLPLFANGSFEIDGKKYPYSGEVIDSKQDFKPENLINLARTFLSAPYLWGGRSPFGIDCSGFVQIVFKIFGLFLPRDSSQQVQHGETIDFIHEAKPCDLAFFGNDEGDIIHVGILLGDSKIIHASGKVRIDTIDHQGIFNADTNKYSHQLRVVKRIVT